MKAETIDIDGKNFTRKFCPEDEILIEISVNQRKIEFLEKKRKILISLKKREAIENRLELIDGEIYCANLTEAKFKNKEYDLFTNIHFSIEKSYKNNGYDTQGSVNGVLTPIQRKLSLYLEEQSKNNPITLFGKFINVPILFKDGTIKRFNLSFFYDCDDNNFLFQSINE